MSIPNRLRILGAVGVASLSLLAACGSSSKSSSDSSASSGDKTSFCKDNDTLNKLNKDISSEADLLKVFKANITTIDQFGKDAPADIKADAKVLVDASHAAIDKNDVSGLSAASVSAASDKVDAYCGTSTTTAKP